MTWNFARGAAIPIPISPPDPYIQFPILSWFEPVDEAKLVFDPMAMLLSHEVIFRQARYHNAVLLLPIVLE